MESLSAESKLLYDILMSETDEIYQAKLASYLARPSAAAATASSTKRSTASLRVLSSAAATDELNTKRDNLTPGAQRLFDPLVGEPAAPASTMSPHAPSSTVSTTTAAAAATISTSTPTRISTSRTNSAGPASREDIQDGLSPEADVEDALDRVSAAPSSATSGASTVPWVLTESDAILYAVSIHNTDLTATVPTTCSAECPSNDSYASVSVDISSAAPNSATTTCNIVPELATPLVSDKALDLDTTGDSSPTASICLPGVPNHSITEEDPVLMSLTQGNSPSLPREQVTWSPVACLTECSGRSIETPSRLQPESYKVFSIAPTVTAIAPWPPPSCTCAGIPLIQGHDFFYNTQRNHRVELLVVWLIGPPLIPPIQDFEDNQGNWSAIWFEAREYMHQFTEIILVKLKPPWPPSPVQVACHNTVDTYYCGHGDGWQPHWPPPLEFLKLLAIDLVTMLSYNMVLQPRRIDELKPQAHPVGTECELHCPGFQPTSCYSRFSFNPGISLETLLTLGYIVCAFGRAIEYLQPLEPKFTWVKFVSAIMPIGPTIKQYYTVVSIRTSCTHVQMRNLFNISDAEHYSPVHTESESLCCKLIGIGMYWPYLQFDDSPGHHLMKEIASLAIPCELQESVAQLVLSQETFGGAVHLHAAPVYWSWPCSSGYCSLNSLFLLYGSCNSPRSEDIGTLTNKIVWSHLKLELVIVSSLHIWSSCCLTSDHYQLLEPAGNASLYVYGAAEFQWEIAWPTTTLVYSTHYGMKLYLTFECSCVSCYCKIEIKCSVRHFLWLCSSWRPRQWTFKYAFLFSWDVTSTIDSIKHMSGMFSRAVQHLERE